MDDTIDLKRQQVMKMLNQEVSKYTNQGSTLPQAISLVCKNLGLNPYDITDKYFPEVKSDVKTSYKDIKANEGSFVTLKGDSGQNQYEVININNKDAIVLRNTDNNEEIIASEDFSPESLKSDVSGKDKVNNRIDKAITVFSRD